MNVEDLLTQKKVEFRQAGKDVLVPCLNPEHDDSSPSCRVDKVTGIFHCLSCGFKGNLFEFFNELRDFRSEAVLNIRKKIQDIVTSSVGLKIPEGAVPYTRDFRGVKGTVYKELEAFTHSDFEDRLVFPLRDVSNKIVAFIARHMLSDAPPKYIISPSGVRPPIYPAKVKPYKDSIILVEGIFDYINLRDKGLDNVGCIFGTNTLSHKNVENRLMPLLIGGVKVIYLMFDGDKPGKDAAEAVKKLVTARTRLLVETIELGEGADPGSLSQEEVNFIKQTIYKEET